MLKKVVDFFTGTKEVTVYHTTSAGNGKRILEEGFRVYDRRPALYGRGVYAWEREEDAHTYGQACDPTDNRLFPKGYDVVAARVRLNKRNSATYDSSEVCDPDQPHQANALTDYCRSQGIEALEIPNPLIERTTHRKARGKAYCFLHPPTH